MMLCKNPSRSKKTIQNIETSTLGINIGWPPNTGHCRVKKVLLFETSVRISLEF